jgi:hypothetical protein
MPDVSPTLSSYLAQFSNWCRNGFADKMKNNVALPGIMLQAYDNPPGTMPTVWLLQVNQQGSFIATQMPLGSGQAGSRL